MTYLSWNDRLAEHFFNEEMAGREVLLYATKDVIDEVGEGLGSVADFRAAVKEGPPWATTSGLCQKAIQAYEGWRGRPCSYPPYVAFLVLFVLAEDAEGDFAPHAYYPRLNQLLGEPPESGAPPSFYRMWELWVDLEKWSREDQGEELGRFTFRIRGKWTHVGLPLSQTLLSHHERENLKTVFYRADLDPTDIPPVNTLRLILLHYGLPGHLLHRRTLQLLETADGQAAALRDALLELVLEELSVWDGTVPDFVTGEGTVSKEAKTGLRICLHTDDLAKEVRTYFRFKTNRAIPDSGLNFEGPTCEEVLTCFEALAGWTSPLKDLTTSRQFDASTQDWRKGFQLYDPENQWRTGLRGEPVRLFVSGYPEGLPDWIESQHLERKCEFMIALEAGLADKVREWGSTSCEAFQQKPYRGLSAGWTMFCGKNAIRSCEDIGPLTLSDLLRVKLVGGIKTGRGNTYLRFGLPSIALENISGDEGVTVNGTEISQADKNSPVWRLPGKYSAQDLLKIQVFRSGSEPLQTRVIRVQDPQVPTSYDEVPRRNKNGEVLNAESSDSFVTGAVVKARGPMECPAFPAILPTHLSSRVIFIGSRPGEITDWPGDDLPQRWHPVWAIERAGHKQWIVHFCGGIDHLNDRDTPGSSLPDKKAVKRWKKAIWINRKITQQPSLPKLLRLWRSYLEAARNA